MLQVMSRCCLGTASLVLGRPATQDNPVSRMHASWGITVHNGMLHDRSRTKQGAFKLDAIVLFSPMRWVVGSS